jgi:hypothetical protein
MADERDYLKKTQDLGRQQLGRDLTDEEIASNFAVHGLARRSAILDQIETESMAGEISGDSGSLRAAGKRLRTLQAMRNAHEKLRRLGR